MTSNLLKQLSKRYCLRFGTLSVRLGFITEAQLVAALARQVREDLDGPGHRLLGQILFEQEIMSAAQIELVMTEMFKEARQEHDGEAA